MPAKVEDQGEEDEDAGRRLDGVMPLSQSEEGGGEAEHGHEQRERGDESSWMTLQHRSPNPINEDRGEQACVQDCEKTEPGDALKRRADRRPSLDEKG
jgi:hypothetical protein